MQVIENAFKAVELGTPVQFRNLQLFPLLTVREGAPDTDAAIGEGYLCLDEALARGAAHITEVSEQGRVPELTFENLGYDPILLVDGEELVGARQNRVLNVSILVGGKRRIVVPVSCVEQGRWSYRSRNFSSAGRNLYARARAEKMQQVSRSMRASGHRASDQGAIWASIGDMAACLSVSSETGAMSDMYEQRADALGAYTHAFEAAPGQVGAIVAIGGQIRGLELFDASGTFAKFMAKLVGSYALDAVEAAGRNDDGGATREQAARFIEKIQRADAQRYPGVDEGEDVRLAGASVAGGALVKGERVIHLAAFDTESASESRDGAAARRRA